MTSSGCCGGSSGTIFPREGVWGLEGWFASIVRRVVNGRQIWLELWKSFVRFVDLAIVEECRFVDKQFLVTDERKSFVGCIGLLPGFVILYKTVVNNNIFSKHTQPKEIVCTHSCRHLQFFRFLVCTHSCSWSSATIPSHFSVHSSRPLRFAPPPDKTELWSPLDRSILQTERETSSSPPRRLPWRLLSGTTPRGPRARTCAAMPPRRRSTG